MLTSDARAVQRYYPQIYFACHADHVRHASTPHSLSSRESGVLAHFDERRPVTPTEIARHLGVSASTFSAQLDRMVKLGYVTRSQHGADRRRWALLLSKKGAQALAATSVLDAGRVRRVLAKLDPAARRRAVEGMALLARASGQVHREKGQQP